MTPEIHFFLGKGGVGKSTTASLWGLHKAQEKNKTLLVSIDAAHNLSDIFNQTFSEKAVFVHSHLAIMEVNIDFWTKKYINKTRQQLNDSYSYLSAFNLTSYFQLIEHTPGIEQYGLFLAFENILFTQTDFDLILFDMPPTSVALDFLFLAKNSLAWLYELKSLRQKINEKHQIVSKIKFYSKNIETDKVLLKLENLIGNYEKINGLLTSSKSKMNVVTNTDKLSKAETSRIAEKIKYLDHQIDTLFINKTKNAETIDYKNFQKKIFIPFSEIELSGIQNLSFFLQKKFF
jgi:arsenite-transporting ATPase